MKPKPQSKKRDLMNEIYDPQDMEFRQPFTKVVMPKPQSKDYGVSRMASPKVKRAQTRLNKAYRNMVAKMAVPPKPVTMLWYVAKGKEGAMFINTVSLAKQGCKDKLMKETFADWPTLYRRGWRIVKVEVREVGAK